MRWQYRTTVLGLCLFAFFVTYFARVAISPVVPFIVADFAVSNTAIGFALTGMWLAVLHRRRLRRFGRRRSAR